MELLNVKIVKKNHQKQTRKLYHKNNRPYFRSYFNNYWSDFKKNKTKEYINLIHKRTEQSILRRLNLKNIIFLNYGNKCSCCGESNPKFLTIDHVNNDGNLERKDSGQEKFLRKIIEAQFPSIYQLLCWNCNLGKYHNKGLCPHKEFGQLHLITYGNQQYG